MCIAELYEQFVRERKHLHNVSPNTLEWYKYSYRAFETELTGCATDSPDLKTALKRAVIRLSESGLQPSSLNDYVRAINAFLRWAHEEGHVSTSIRLDYLKEPQKVIESLRPQQVRDVLTWKPSGFAEQRLAALVALLLDTGMRIAEALNLRRQDADFDNLLIRVEGKGGKHRLVPMSVELRKVLFRWLQRHPHDRVFPTLQGRRCIQRNILRGFHELAAKLSIEGTRFSPHTLRHTFAVSYLRAGGNVLYLQRILGHSTLEMTNRYVRSLGVEDLAAVHNRLSLLNR